MCTGIKVKFMIEPQSMSYAKLVCLPIDMPYTALFFQSMHMTFFGSNIYKRLGLWPRSIKEKKEKKKCMCMAAHRPRMRAG